MSEWSLTGKVSRLPWVLHPDQAHWTLHRPATCCKQLKGAWLHLGVVTFSGARKQGEQQAAIYCSHKVTLFISSNSPGMATHGVVLLHKTCHLSEDRINLYLYITIA